MELLDLIREAEEWEKWQLLRQKFGTNSHVPNWASFTKATQAKARNDSYPRKSSVDNHLSAFPNKVLDRHFPKDDLKHIVLQDIREVIEEEGFCGYLSLANALQTCIKFSLRQGFLKPLVYIMNIKGDEKNVLLVCSTLIWPQNPSFWKGCQRVMWLGNSF